MDTLTPEEPSKRMGKNTRPELPVRSLLHRADYRFSLHAQTQRRIRAGQLLKTYFARQLQR